MNKMNLSPFDCDMCAMIEDLTKTAVEIETTPENIHLSWEQSPCDKTTPEGQKATAIQQAVNGRLGNRALMWEYKDGRQNVWFASDPTEYPEEQRDFSVAIDPKAGQRYCRTLQEVTAIQVDREKLEELKAFTGGGMLTIPREPNARAIYTFPNGNGMLVDVPEMFFIVRDESNDFTTMHPKEFARLYEPKGIRTVGNYDEQPARPSVTEIMELFNELFGTNIASRCRKIEEEFNEYKEAVKHAMPTFDDPGRMNAVIDELADLNAVVFHSAAILGIPQRELLEMAYDKVKGRQTDPMYKRAYNCGHCRNYMNEDADGNGHCAVHKWGITYFSPVNECADFKPLK